MDTNVLRRLGIAGLGFAIAATAAALQSGAVFDRVAAAGSQVVPVEMTGEPSAASPASASAVPSPPVPAAQTESRGTPAGGPPSEPPGKGKGKDKPTPPPTEEPVEPADPPFTVGDEELDASLHCSDLTDEVGADREPVLLVHGTFTWGEEQFAWSWLPELDARGYDWCVVTYPDRGFGDLQTSAEYVAHAILAMHEATGRQVDMAGHSQGGLMPRWALKYWPSANAATDDFVMLASPNHGTAVAGSGPSPMPMPAAFWQMRQGSAFVTALNDGDESPGGVSYTSLYTWMDELVQPSYGPTATALLAEDDNVTNLAVQEACPGRVVDHLTIGTTDRASFELTMAAFAQEGPLDVAGLDLVDLCKPSPDEAGALYDGLGQLDDATGAPVGRTVVTASGTLPEPFQRFESMTAAFDLFLEEFEREGTWDWHMTAAEPETRPYAQ